MAERLPGRDQPHADDLAEHLADLGRGGEVTVDAERLAGGVVAVFRIEQAHGHVLGDGDRTVGGDQVLDAAGEARHRAVAGFAVTIAQMPASTIGSDSTMPIVSQPPRR